MKILYLNRSKTVSYDQKYLKAKQTKNIFSYFNSRAYKTIIQDLGSVDKSVDTGSVSSKSHRFEPHLTQYFLSLSVLFLNYLTFLFYGLLLQFCLLQRKDGSLRNSNVPHQKKCVKVIHILNEVTASTVKCNGRRFTTEINPNEH